MKNLKDQTVEMLEEWEKVILVKYLCERGLPQWGEGENFYRVFTALFGWSSDKANEVIQQADNEEKAITNVPAIQENRSPSE